MFSTHEFHTPRNLYEKLIRDSEKLDIIINGDNIYNFISTAYHLKDWVKNSPIMSSVNAKRFAGKIANDKNIKTCGDILTFKKGFHFESDLKEKNKSLIIGEEYFDPLTLRDEIMELYSSYFKVK
ncbi:MAG: hypothetical protein K9I69_05895 [Ignavibacteriales bacterium]|nr:hypothetical protein [Ignavibacteriales bacterium]MCF8304911.1 hypothetical protein [Ignavibacteriales bacterium]MCF8314600.1 hypothetical protein [Ignavibacteriales bacterium]MCF8436363.1 hypothetical protein [Ignavibacteriales bacterium]